VVSIHVAGGRALKVSVFRTIRNGNSFAEKGKTGGARGNLTNNFRNTEKQSSSESCSGFQQGETKEGDRSGHSSILHGTSREKR